ncbi:helix-turn-helix transcriptional regulator [Paenibacillus sp. IB182496]|uniref:Helix-turn-helix transcriptional regulator n=1 Tax=Paenibacillus sabuli TaxID=2772509 RepID=A0A927GSR8_9BACL|nr:AraC family transcriptional regulator [Paenibacillus sabuli]MBD2845957.1 helix-turn-helix transcriptional regulator [Paenibacillus sabuli]
MEAWTQMAHAPIQVRHYIFAGPFSDFMMAEQTTPRVALLTVESGRFTYAIGDERGEAGFGDLIFCPPGVPFRRRALSPIRFHHFQFDWTEQEAGGGQRRHPPAKVTVSDPLRLKSTFAYLRRLQENRTVPDLQPHLYRDRLVADLLLQCELDRVLAEATRSPADPLMRRVREEIDAHALEPGYTLRQTARRLRLDPSRLTRRFQAAYGQAPLAYLTKLRLDEATTLLVETEDTLESIACRCGYDNGSYFCRVFTAKIGVNPSDYRLRYRFSGG